jgi:hypothetical protein
MLPHTMAASPSPLGTPEAAEFVAEEHVETPVCHNHDVDSADLVALKITLLGDRQIGKTSFLVCVLDFHFHLCLLFSLSILCFKLFVNVKIKNKQICLLGCVLDFRQHNGCVFFFGILSLPLMTHKVSGDLVNG